MRQSPSAPHPVAAGDERFVGIDVGAETLKVVGLRRVRARFEIARHHCVEHGKRPGPVLLDLLAGWEWPEVTAAAACGRFAGLLRLPRVPVRHAQELGFRALHDEDPATVISIGARGFSVLELRRGAASVFRENSRCSQGTGNFLRQLVGRFGLSVEAASESCRGVGRPAVLSGRCPVILKTDLTHLANQGVERDRILAGLFDAVCDNVLGLVRPRLAPPRVLLAGGVTRAPRVRQRVARYLEEHSMRLLPCSNSGAVFLEALGCAHFASECAADTPPAVGRLLTGHEAPRLEATPALRDHLRSVRRIPAGEPVPVSGSERLVLGLDIGSTGSKAVALAIDSRQPVWQEYVPTRGDPVGAARELVGRFAAGPAGRGSLGLLAATGSGREVVGSLLASCYGHSSVFVLNEIAAHAAGALYFDRRVDTIFEIGGQDAKYIRLARGRVVESAMNHACSAGTGSFIEEQGKRLVGGDDLEHIDLEHIDLEHIAARALDSSSGVSLGQHCSVFMAEVIDQAVEAGAEADSILAGLYDSVVQNYLNRVKGARPVGRVVFCQGMPFLADALAAAVARQTGRPVIVPPHPGTVGALGIALLALRNLSAVGVEKPSAREPLEPARFLDARLEVKDSFVCRANRGCAPPGNRCRIERLTTKVEGARRRSTWGGACDLWERDGNRRKLPAGAPDPFRGRSQLLRSPATEIHPDAGARRIALSGALPLAELLPFFTTFFGSLGLAVEITADTGRQDLDRGVETSSVPLCAPMQVFQGVASRMAAGSEAILFLPMLRSLPAAASESRAVVCPIVQGSADLVRWNLPPEARSRVLSPVIDCDDGLRSRSLRLACRDMARRLRVVGGRWRRAFELAVEAQDRFERLCRDLGRQALEFCQSHDVTPVVVLGRPYSIHDPLLNAGVPTLLREQGALPIPVDCYPLDDRVPSREEIYWAHGRRNLRAARQIATTPGVYGLWCSNYSCGPDSFNLHFFAEEMDGKPFAVIETDGHVGEAGTRTRIEAFLYGIGEAAAGRPGPPHRPARPSPSDSTSDVSGARLVDIRRRGERVLIPRMGPAAEVLAACLRGVGVEAEALPRPDPRCLKRGQRHTSGKECLPFTVTLGSLLQRLEAETDPERRFAFFMPTACGPCRFGIYHLLHRITLERAGWADRVRIWSPSDRDYFEGLPAGFATLAMSGFSAMDALYEARHELRAERPAEADAIGRRYRRLLLDRLERMGRRGLSPSAALWQVMSGDLFGCPEILRRAGSRLAGLAAPNGKPTVLLVGEIYVRSDPFSNDFLVDRLEKRGLRVRLAPFGEWLEYAELDARFNGGSTGAAAHLHAGLHRRIRKLCWAAMGEPLGWPPRPKVDDALEASDPYIRRQLSGEAVLTLGAPLEAWRRGAIDGTVSVVPLECMPGRLAEAQFLHAAEREGLPSLTIPVSGEPVASTVLDDFAFRLHAGAARSEAPTHCGHADRPVY